MTRPTVLWQLTHRSYASIRILPNLWGDVDAKYFPISQDRNIMRLGGGISVRF